jgi:hypothetical protein
MFRHGSHPCRYIEQSDCHQERQLATLPATLPGSDVAALLLSHRPEVCIIMKKLKVLILLAVFALLLPAGCRSLNQVTPAGMDDAAIEAEVRARLTSDLALGAFQISVGVSNGVVTLSGEVDTNDQRRNAAQTASRVDGVRSVINNLRLRT